MLTYHNDPAVKDKYVQRFAAHRAADEVVQGLGYSGKRGCFVGCTLNKYDHAAFETELGWPQWLARLADRIFEGLPKAEAPQFGTDLLAAMPIGVDVDKVRWQLAVQRHTRDRDRLLANPEPYAKECVAAITQVIAYCELEIKTQGAAAETAETAEAAESAAAAAKSAAEAAKSAWSAAEAAKSAWPAAEAAESAWPAAEAAESARAAAQSARAAAQSAAASAAKSAWPAAEAAESAWPAAEAAESARAAAQSVESAESAETARAAAQSAAQSAAESAETARAAAQSAAQSAAESVESVESAESAWPAGLDPWQWERDTLIALLKECK